jgi:hypothetical protein
VREIEGMRTERKEQRERERRERGEREERDRERRKKHGRKQVSLMVPLHIEYTRAQTFQNICLHAHRRRPELPAKQSPKSVYSGFIR